MKRKVILWSLLGLMSVGGASYYWASSETDYYEPRTAEKSDQGYKDAMEYLRQLRSNVHTGQVEIEDILKARREVAELRAARQKKGSIGLQWQLVGPTDQGGRTRTIHIDKDDSNIMYAGSVSGGLFKSTNRGRSWKPITTPAENLSVTDIAEAPNGDLYFSTGESQYIGLGNFAGTPSFIGGGIFKSTDDGQTFTLLPGTEPNPGAPGGNDWAAIGKIAVDPNNSNVVYAATFGGLKKSTDGGQTWTDPVGFGTNATDMVMTPSGTLWVKLSDQILKSTDGSTFTEMTCIGSNCAGIPRNGSRMRIAVSPQDEDYVYVVATVVTSGGISFDKAYRSTDGGSTWTVIGRVSVLLNPHQTQGRWNNALEVDPANKDRIIVGGVTLWEWSLSNGWQRIALLASQAVPFYVHADNHDITFDTTRANTFFVANDGGIFKTTDNGQTFSEENPGYSTTQFYDFNVGVNGQVMGGTQDNGVILVDPNNFIPTAALDQPPVATPNGFFSGDGGFTALSKLNPDVRFIEYQFARMGRSSDGGVNYSDIFDERMHPNINNIGETYGSGRIAPFIAPFLLHEDLNDPASTDSVTLEAAPIDLNLGFGNGTATYSGNFTRPRSQARFITDSFKITAGNQVVTADASGNLIGDGTGNFDAQTGAFTVTFTNGTTQELKATVDIFYPQGSVITLKSAINDLPITNTLAQDLNPGESIKFQDPVQSIFIMGLNSSDVLSQANRPFPPFSTFDRNEIGGIWMTRGALTDINLDPKWWKIGKLGNNNSPSALAMSYDGDVLFVGTSGGRLYRFSNLNAARDSASASVDDEYRADTIIRNTSVIQRDVLGSFGRYVADISFDVNDKNRVLVSLANYGGGSNIRYSDNALNATSTAQFRSVQGSGLPDMPVYTAIFNFTDPDGSEVIIGTDQGIFTTDDIDAGQVQWTQEIDGMANVPVFDLEQDRVLVEGETVFGGAVYAATHGRGFFKTNSTEDFYMVGQRETTYEPLTAEELPGIYPNPTDGPINVEVNLANRSDVTFRVYTITGQLVKQFTERQVPAGTPVVSASLSGLDKGTYIVSVSHQDGEVTGKVILR